MTTNSAKKPAKPMTRLVADDNGYASHKFAWFDEDGQILVSKIPSLVQAGGSGVSTTTGGRKGAYEVDGSEYHCSTMLSNPISIRNADYPLSVANRVLFNHGLSKFGLLSMPVRAAVTLPFRDYFNTDGTLNTALRESVSNNFAMRNVRVLGCEAQPDVVGVRVCAEALSAWFDWAMTSDGDMTDGYDELLTMNGEMLVVDIGGSTTDLASLGLVEGELLINHEKSGTERVGVLDALEKLDELVRAVMAEQGITGLSGHDGKLPQNLLEMILDKGTCTYAGRQWSFEAERELACQAVAERVVAYIKSKVGNPGMYYAIQVVGGGAIVFRKWIKGMFVNAIFGDEFSNARGALKYLRGES